MKNINFRGSSKKSIGSSPLRLERSSQPEIGSPSFYSGRLPHPFSLAAATVNIVNLVNLPTPYCICNVKNGAKSTEKGIDKNLHNKLPTPLYSSQCSQCSQTGFLAIFHQLLECIFYNIRSKIAVLSLFCEPNEYVCTYMKPKAIFCYGMCEHCELGVFMKFTQFAAKVAV